MEVVDNLNIGRILSDVEYNAPQDHHHQIDVSYIHLSLHQEDLEIYRGYLKLVLGLLILTLAFLVTMALLVVYELILWIFVILESCQHFHQLKRDGRVPLRPLKLKYIDTIELKVLICD